MGVRIWPLVFAAETSQVALAGFVSSANRPSGVVNLSGRSMFATFIERVSET